MVAKLTLAVGVMLSVLLSVLLAASYPFWRETLRAQIDAHLSAVASGRRDLINAEVELLRQRIVSNIERGEFRGFLDEGEDRSRETLNRTYSQAVLKELAAKKPVLSACLVNPQGRVLLASDPDDVDRELVDSEAFQRGLLKPYVGRPIHSGDRFVTELSAPVVNWDDPVRITGILLLKVDASSLAATVRETTGLGETGEVILGVRDGEQIRFLFPSRNSALDAVPIERAPALAAAVDGRETFMKPIDYRGVKVLAVSRPVGFDGWGLVAKMDESEAYAPIARSMRRGILWGGGVALAGLGAAYLLARGLTAPLRKLTQGAARVAGGDYDSPVPVTSADELGTLSQSFNEMTCAIRARGAERDDAEAALRDADQRKDEFLAMLGHELRNPLSAIAHAVRLWKESANDPDTAAVAHEVIGQQTETLSRLVDDLLDVARITKGKIELRKRAVEVGKVIARALETVRPLLAAKRHTFDLALWEGGRLLVNADPMRLEQIVANLLTNAAKYTPDGGRISVVEKCENDEAVVIVSDNGSGIAPEMLPKIFELFTQGDRSLERTTGGLGIGLNLCRHLVELHGGSISARSDGHDRGSEFTLRLPIVAAPEVAAPPPPPPPTPGPARLRILLVDDNVETVRLLSRLLVRRGHEIAVAYDGLVALELAREFKPDVFLLDLGLPGMDGYTLAERLRAEGFAGALMVAISGYAQEHDRIRSRVAGFDHHFAKPVDFETLAALLGSVQPGLPG